MKELKFISPFKKLCITIGNLPTAYIESMSYYEGLTFLVNYLANNVIPAVNNNSEVVKELQDQFVILKNYVDNYFENLDVQEEINNKLDEMADNGELTDIIAQYLGLAGILAYSTVADMKAAENLVEGSKCCTYGYYNINDGGAASYNIRKVLNTDVIDEASIIALNDDTLIAELVCNEVNVKTFGCYGDGIHDDYANLNKAISYAKTNDKKLTSPEGNTYLIETGIDLSNVNMDFSNSKITTSQNIDIVTIDSNNYYGNISNLVIDCNDCANIGLYLKLSKKHNFNNITLDNIYSIGIKYDTGYENNLININLNDQNSNGSTGIIATSSDSNFENILIINCFKGIKSVGKNFWSHVHGWISDKDIVVGSTFIDVNSGYFMGDDIYSDTYQYTFYTDDNRPYVLVNNMLCEWNTSIMTDAIMTGESPYIWYNKTNTIVTSSYVNISNMEINGKIINGNKVPITNEAKWNGVITNSIKYNVVKETDPSLSSVDGNFTVSVNKVKRITSNLTQIEFIGTINATLHNGLITVGNTPFRPTSDINYICAYGTNEWNISDILYMYINTSGNLSINIPNTLTGNITIKINTVYKTNDYLN